MEDGGLDYEDREFKNVEEITLQDLGFVLDKANKSITQLDLYFKELIAH
ncbi:unnamed protein product, partial [Vitis vinifera]